MKNVLLIGFFWPYTIGSKRIYGLARYLSHFGWSPIILTAPLQRSPEHEFRVIETGYVGSLGSWVSRAGFDAKQDISDQLRNRISRVPPWLRTFLKSGYLLYNEFFCYPDEHKRWIALALKSANELIAREKIDGMISIYPLSSHVVAHELKKKHGIPWIADLADLWSDNSAYAFGRIRRFFDRRLERKILKTADALTTSSWPLAERLSKIHDGRKTTDIIIGYDPDLFDGSPPAMTDKFTITYTGKFYPEKRDPLKFLAALHELLMEGSIKRTDVDVRFYGPAQDWIDAQIRRLELADVVKQHGSVSLKECIAKQRESHVLLQVNWGDESEKGVFSGKFLDYLGAQRPILAAGGAGCDEVVKEIISSTKTGVYASENEEIKKALLTLYGEYKKAGLPGYGGDLVQVERFSNRQMAACFSDILSGLTKR